MSSKTLAAISNAVTRGEVMSILFRTILSAKDVLTEDAVRRIIEHVGADYDKTLAEVKAMSDEEWIAHFHEVLDDDTPI